MIVWKLATRPATATSAKARAPRPSPKIARRLSNSGLSLRPSAAAPGCEARREHERPERASDQRREPEHDPARQVALGRVRLLGRERQLLDREVEPDRERQRCEHAASAVREPRASPGVRAFARSKCGIAPA
jgi:hypothetical protein